MPDDCYFSADVEADGPIPGPYSMLSFGLVVAGTFDGSTFVAADLDAPETFYRELRPVSDEHDPAALAVSGLDRDRLRVEGVDPAVAFADAAAWITATAGDRRPVLVAYPLSFDWMWLHWYFVRFTGGFGPFGVADCLDVKTMIATALGVTVGDAHKRGLPPALRSDRPHTHHALDDAIEQADVFARLFAYTRRHTTAREEPT